VISVRQGAKPVLITVSAASQASLAGSLKSAGLALKSAEWDIPVSLTNTSDTYDSQMWGLRSTRAETVWTQATNQVTVAVLDTGIGSHNDLTGRVLPGRSILSGAISTNVADGHGHGTHVSGTIAALANNNLGIAGVAPNAKILPVKVLSDSGSGYLSDVAAGIIYAADSGAKVINMSLGSSGTSQTLQDACDYAWSRGVTVVAAAGNGGPTASPNYPAADPNDHVIAVAAIDSSNSIAYFSQAGSYVDIAAPGVSVMSTTPNNAYDSWDGTSMASPHVAAVAALAYGKSPNASVSTVRAAILAGARDLGTAGRDNTFGAGAVDAPGTLERLTSTPGTTTTTSSTTSSTSTLPPTTTTTAPPLPPNAPSRPLGTAGNGSVTLTWGAPSPLPTPAIQDYTVLYQLRGSSTWSIAMDGVSDARQAVVTGLTNGMYYLFKVAAANANGVGAYSPVSPAVRPIGAVVTTTTTTVPRTTTTTIPRTTTTTIPRTTTTTVPRTTTTTVPRTTTTTVPPTTTLPPLLKAPGIITIAPADTHLSINGSAVAGAASYQLSRDGVVIQQGSRPSFYDLNRGTVAGTYAYSMRAVTSTGRAGTPSTMSFTVTPPAAPTLVSSSVNLRSLTVTVALSGDTKTWQLLREGVVVGKFASSKTTAVLSQPIGTASYSLRAISLSGAANGTSSFSVTIAR
jgi:subtilisin family serine protease